MIATLSADERVIIILSAMCLVIGTLIALWLWADHRRLREGLEEDREADRY